MDIARNADRLRTEMETLWGADLFGRPSRPRPLVAMGIAEDGTAFSFDDTVSQNLRNELLSNGELHRPGALEDWYQQRMPGSKAAVTGWPAFVFDECPTEPADFRLLTSNTSGAKPVRPEPWGDDAEWEELLAGRLGPWAVSLEGDQTVAVCYTPVASDLAAEAGVWTHPEARRRGHAVAVTAAWANVAWERFETLFYSTSLDNLASQAVARRLGVRPIGCLWQLNLAESS